MSSNRGFDNEKLIAEALNGKKFSEINRNLQTMVRDMFGYQDDEEVISAFQIDSMFKPDISITYKGQTKYVSIKSGTAKVFHGENIKSFILFLRSKGVSKETQKTILLFQYGDGTLDGSGKKRLDSYEAREWLHKQIKKANMELNSNPGLIDSVLERTMYQGLDESAPAVDFIYFGTPEYGVVVSKKQIHTYVSQRGWRYYDNLHIGPIFIKPHARYANRQIVSVERRERVRCYWPDLMSDLDRISKRYTF